MPELPEVHTTVEGLKKVIVGKTIKDVWSDYYLKTAHGERKTIKNKKYFDKFRKIVKGGKIKSIERRGKNILINLDNTQTIVVHMKMTGHLMYGQWRHGDLDVGLPLGSPASKSRNWKSVTGGAFDDPYNQYLHFVLTLSNGYQLALSDLRKFARIELIETAKLSDHKTFKTLGPDALDKKLTPKLLSMRLQRRPNLPIKLALMDQTIIAGIGNIYADEVLWDTGILPTRKAGKISLVYAKKLLHSMRKILKKSIAIGGDSKSDYRNIYGERGGFHNYHMAYHMHGKACTKRGCSGIIERMKLGGRSAHFCPVHQK